MREEAWPKDWEERGQDPRGHADDHPLSRRDQPPPDQVRRSQRRARAGQLRPKPAMTTLEVGAEAHAQYQSALALFGQGRYADGVQLLDRAAHAGHVGAMSLLGAQLLSGRAV